MNWYEAVCYSKMIANQRKKPHKYANVIPKKLSFLKQQLDVLADTPPTFRFHSYLHNDLDAAVIETDKVQSIESAKLDFEISDITIEDTKID